MFYFIFLVNIFLLFVDICILILRKSKILYLKKYLSPVFREFQNFLSKLFSEDKAQYGVENALCLKSIAQFVPEIRDFKVGALKM